MNGSRTWAEGEGGGGIMLFGVRVREGGGSFRKSVSMNNLSQYEQPHSQSQDSNNADAGYASDDVVHHSDRCRGRKRGMVYLKTEIEINLNLNLN